MTISPGGGPAWGRLGDALIQRRIDLHYRTRRAFCDARQIDYRVAFDIEKARRVNFGRATLLDIARAYAVTPESMERTLRGGALEPADAPACRPEPSGRLQLRPGTGGQFTTSRERYATQPLGPPMGPIVQSVREDIAAALARAGIRGRDIFPDAGDEAKLWDDTDRLPEDARVEMIATLRRIRLEEEEPGPGHHARPMPRRAG